MTFTPTAEQLAIVTAATSSTENLLLEALAGAAKTSTLELICRALPSGSPILSLAFNKRIAEEMTKRLPGNVQCSTVNSIGHRVWSAATGKRLIVDTKKSYDLLIEASAGLAKSNRDEAREVFSETLRAISAAKLSGYVPENVEQASRLLDQEDFVNYVFEEDPPGWQLDIIDRVLTESIRLAYSGQIDFDDQVYMPTLFGGSFPRFPLVLIDEAQDLSALNHAMLGKLVTKRVIAVGDPYQSIYGFRGAVSNGMEALQRRFNMTTFPLSVSFRCPIAVVEAARFRAPHMQYAPGAPEGQVTTLETWTPATVPDGSAIICRNNAPLLSCALAFLKAGRGIKLLGSDIGPSMIKTLTKFGDLSMPRDEVLKAIAEWEAEKLAKAKRSPGGVKDRASCLRVFANAGSNLNEAIAYARHLFEQAGPILLMTGHKSKGLEFQTVFHLNPDLIPSMWSNTLEEVEQEYNLRYVILTRAKSDYFEVQLERLVI